MRLYNSIHGFCDSYSIPINESTIGYLQFYSEFVIPNSVDILTVKCFIIDAAGAEIQTTPLNIIAQYLGNNTFRVLIQGFHNIPKLFRFRFKIVITTESKTAIFYSDLFSYMKCENSYPVIPCLTENQQYSSYGAFLGQITGNIVYQSWHTNEPKKYTPVIFLRNVSFNKKTSTVEYKKLNNKPLKSTLRKNYNLICEPVSSIYSEYVMDIFGFGKVNLLGNTYAFDTYSDEILDEKDCCSLYKISATAYKETQLRLQCSNNCVVLDPVTCDDVSPLELNIPIHVYANDLVAGYTKDITQIILNATGFDISELGFLNGIDNDCWKIVYNGIQVLLEYDPVDPNGSCQSLLISYSICDILQIIYLQIIVDNTKCLRSTLNSMSYSAAPPTGWTISGNFTTQVTLEYTTNNINWISIGSFGPGSSIFTNSLPLNNFKIRVIAECDTNLISNTLEVLNSGIDENFDYTITGIECLGHGDGPTNWDCYCSASNTFALSDGSLLNTLTGFIRLKIDGGNGGIGLSKNGGGVLIINEVLPVTSLLDVSYASSVNNNNFPFCDISSHPNTPAVYTFEYSTSGTSGWTAFTLTLHT